MLIAVITSLFKMVAFALLIFCFIRINEIVKKVNENNKLLQKVTSEEVNKAM